MACYRFIKAQYISRVRVTRPGKRIELILELAVLNVRPGLGSEFEVAFRQASPIIASTPGYISHELHRCIETKDRYTLLVRWETIEAHTVGFRTSPHYAEWRKMLHHFYDPFPTIEHYEQVDLDSRA